MTDQEYNYLKQRLAEEDTHREEIRKKNEVLSELDKLLEQYPACDGWTRNEKVSITTDWIQSSGNDGNGPEPHERPIIDISNPELFRDVLRNYVKELKNELLKE